MASYLRPRRGKKATAESQAVVLKKGEVFFEIDANGISTGSSAKACGKIKMGDGSTTYSNLGYFIDVDTSVVAFTDTATATAENQGEDYYSQLNAIAPTATVKSIFGNMKSLLYKMATNLTELNNETGWILEITTNAPVSDKTYTVENLPKYKQMLIMMLNIANTTCYASNISTFDNTTNQFFCSYLTANAATTNTFYYNIYAMIVDSTHIRVTEAKTMSANFYAKIYFK